LASIVSLVLDFHGGEPDSDLLKSRGITGTEDGNQVTNANLAAVTIVGQIADARASMRLTRGSIVRSAMR
jgi:hypothetical protein